MQTLTLRLSYRGRESASEFSTALVNTLNLKRKEEIKRVNVFSTVSGGANRAVMRGIDLPLSLDLIGLHNGITEGFWSEILKRLGNIINLTCKRWKTEA